jgi:hypothetical protein
MPDYVRCLRDVYTVLEKKNTSSSTTDIFLKTILGSHGGLTEKEWTLAEKQRQYEKALSMKMGDMHEELLGKLPGYVTLPNGHSTGCDVARKDESEYWEIKNADNTLNSGGAKSVLANLNKVIASGKTAGLVLINTTKKRLPRFGAQEAIIVIDGKDAYTRFSGRASFWDDLMATLKYTFAEYKTYERFKRENP